VAADPDVPSARERQLARELRTLRRIAQFHGKDVAQRLGWSASKISRIENGRSGVNEEDLELLLELYSVPAGRATNLRRLAPAIRAGGWWAAYAQSLGPGYTNLIKLEAGSSTLRGYCAVVPHALLLTSDFARRIIVLPPQRPSAEEVERRLDVVRRRQARLSSSDQHDPLQLSVVLDESILHRRIVTSNGQAADLPLVREQLQKIVDLAAEPNITIQVLPFAAGLPPVSAGSFSILGSAAQDGGPDVVCLENKTRIFYIDSEDEVHSYVQDFESLTSWALDAGESVARIRHAISMLAG
jgi:transcriptional regulator with XRE-family HTH domain